MFSTADKTTRHASAVQQKAAGTSFFKKAGEEGFFGAKENPTFPKVPVQAKLTVSSPDDPQEKEADAVADQVMRMPEPVMASSPMAENKKEKLNQKEGEEVQAKRENPVAETIRADKEPAEKLSPKLAPAIQRLAEHGASHQERIGTSQDIGSVINQKNSSLYSSEVVQRSGRAPPSSSTSFEQSLAASKGGGSPMPNGTRNFMESRFNADFSGVRIHTNTMAVNLTNKIQAQAFAHGNDIYFNQNKYSPDSSSGRTLLAHELTHTIQQGGGARKKYINSANHALSTDVQMKCAECQKEEEHILRKQKDQTTSAGSDSKKQNSANQKNNPEASGSASLTGEQSKEQSVPDKSLASSSESGSSTPATSPNKTEATKSTTPATASTHSVSKTGNTDSSSQVKFGGTSGKDGVAGKPTLDSSAANPQLDNSSSEGLLNSIGSASASSFAQVVSQSQGIASQVQLQEKAELATIFPEIERPTGLPHLQDRQEPASTHLPTAQPVEFVSPSGRTGSEPEVKHREPSGPTPGSQLSTTVAAPPQDESGGSWWNWLTNRVHNFVSSIPTHDAGLTTSAGPRPVVDVSGEADPVQTTQFQQASNQAVGTYKATADQVISTPFGENVIYPVVPAEKLKTSYKPTAPSAIKGGKVASAPKLPKDLQVKFDNHETPRLKSQAKEKIGTYWLKEAKYRQESQQTLLQGQQEIALQNEHTRLEQQEYQQKARGDVEAERQRWREENRQIQEKYSNQSEEKQQEIDTEVQKKVQLTEKESDLKLSEAEQKAETERQNTERQAAEKKREAQNKPRSFWDSVKDSISSVFASLRQAINGLFENLRRLVKAIMEAAKAVVHTLIETARNVINGLIKGFGVFLKGLVSVALAAFPAAAAKARAWIDQRVDAAVDAVNKAADKLKQTADKILDKVAEGLDKALSAVQATYNLVLNGLQYLAEAPFKMMELLAKLSELLKEYLPLPDGIYKLCDQIKTRVAKLKDLWNRRPKDVPLPRGNPASGLPGLNAAALVGNMGSGVNPPGSALANIKDISLGADINGSNQTIPAKSAPQSEDNKLGGGPGGGCGLCYQDSDKKVPGPTKAGGVAHQMIQTAFMMRHGAVGGRTEFPVDINENICRPGIECADLAIHQPLNKKTEIGEIKPANDTKNIDQGIKQLLKYKAKLKLKYPTHKIGALTGDIPSPLPFPTLSPTPGCQEQLLHIINTHTGLYLYTCTPSYSELLKKGCKCNNKIEDPDPVPVDAEEKEKSKEKAKKKEKDPEKEKEPEKEIDWDGVFAKIALGALILTLAVGLIAAIICAVATSPTVIGGIACGTAAVAAAATIVLLVAKFSKDSDNTA